MSERSRFLISLHLFFQKNGRDKYAEKFIKFILMFILLIQRNIIKNRLCNIAAERKRFIQIIKTKNISIYIP